MRDDITGSCHCGAVRFRFDGVPEDATICNCSICRRYGVIWAYGWLDQTIHIEDPEAARVRYVHGDREIGFHHCGTCGCVIDWTGLAPDGTDGRTRVAVNLRLADPQAVAAIPLRRFDGADAFEDLPTDGRCIADIVV